MGVGLWSTTVGDNDDADLADGVDWREGQLPSTVNNTGRAMMKAVAELLKDLGGTIVSTGSTNEYTITTNVGYAALAENMVIVFEADKTSSGAATATVDGLTQKSIFQYDGTATEAGDIVDGGVYFIVYNAGVDGFIGLNIFPKIVGTVQRWLPAEDWKPTITNGAGRYYAEDATNDIIEDSLAFDTTTQEFATIDVAMPKRWNEGTVTFTPYWRTTGGSSSQTVQWGFSGVAVGDDDAADAAPGTAQTSSDTWIADSDLHVGPATAAITINGTPAAGDVVRFKVSRNVASDDLGADARFQGAVLTFTTDAATDT